MNWLAAACGVLVLVAGLWAYLRPDFVVDAANLIAACF